MQLKRMPTVEEVLAYRKKAPVAFWADEYINEAVDAEALSAPKNGNPLVVMVRSDWAELLRKAGIPAIGDR